MAGPFAYVTIYVEGGVVQDVAADYGIEVEIVDFDNLREEREDDPPLDYDEHGHPGPLLRAWIDGVNPDGVDDENELEDDLE